MNIENPGPRIELADILSLERAAGVHLPNDYRDFLLLHNGGLPCGAEIDVAGAAEMPTDVQVLFGLGRRVESSNLDWNLTEIRACSRHDLLPIARDSGGNVFCFQLQDGVAKDVVYCEVFSDEFCSNDGGIYFIAPTFNEFMDQLCLRR